MYPTFVSKYYRRHKDAEHGSISEIRKYSLLLYLNPKDWDSRMDGGQLRIHFDSGTDQRPIDELPNFIDIVPSGGKLILFSSDKIPHEVLETHRERWAVVGWFLEANNSISPTTDKLDSMTTFKKVTPFTTTTLPIHPDVLQNLKALRDASSSLASKLKPSPPKNESTLWFAFDDSYTIQNQEEKSSIDDNDPKYWNKIVSFDPEGYITTLSFGGMRLKPWVNLVHPLLNNVVTLHLANTDLAVSDLVTLLQSTSQGLQHLHLGGNNLGNIGGILPLKHVLSSLFNLTTLDLRYNDIGPAGAAILGDILLQQQQNYSNDRFQNCSSALWDVLYLEGNQLGDDGIIALGKGVGMVRELYLGQNSVGSKGAIFFITKYTA